jgi:WD40 repeat protein
MSWSNSKFTMNSFFGYNAGENINFYSYPDSFTNNITNIASQSNAKIPGKWVFMVSSFNLNTTSTTSATSTKSTKSTTSTTSTTSTASITGTTSTGSLLLYTLKGNLATGSYDSTIKIWNPNTGTLVFTLSGHTHWIYSLATLPNGNLEMVITKWLFG